MGISSNQARFLALTSRQVDLEHRIQQICQRRLRLASELENTATSYNNQISNRKLYGMNLSGGIGQLSIVSGGSNGCNLQLTDNNGSVSPLKDSNGNAYCLGTALNSSSTPFVEVKTWVGSGTDAFKDNNNVIIKYSDLGLPNGSSMQDCIDAGLRSGIFIVAAKADEFSQDTFKFAPVSTNPDYEVKDWRTVPQLADELYKGDDVNAENKYDQTINEINAQDKKLQLEQTSIEVEYKAITSEKDSVKKVLDTNAQSSFKYFS